MREIILDTETTGLSPQEHRIVEIGCVEVIDRVITDRHFHVYINPERTVDPGAERVHGLTTTFLSQYACFNHIVQDFLTFVGSDPVVIHNAPFDMGFIRMELERLGQPRAWLSEVIDTLVLARQKHPGQKNSLDALCKRYQVDASGRHKHGALVDAHLLAQVYLKMTGGQEHLSFMEPEHQNNTPVLGQGRQLGSIRSVYVHEASSSEQYAHAHYWED